MLDVDNYLIVARILVLLAEAGLFGTFCVRALAGREVGGRLLGGLYVLLLIGLPGWLAVQSLSMGGSLDAVPLVLGQTQVGHLAMLRAGCWLASFALWRWRGTPGAILPAALALALHAGAGHAAAEGDLYLLISVMAHVLAGAAWIGGLPALFLALDDPSAPRLVRRYAWFGLVCVLTVATTATLQALALAGGLPGLFGTDYGHALLIKITLLVLLVMLATLHRFVLAPRLPRSLRALRLSVSVEAVLGMGVLVTASVLASLPPGAHSQPDWPFSWRLSFSLMDDPDLRREVVEAAAAVGGAVALLLLAVLIRRSRVLATLAVLAAAAIVWLAIPHFDLLFLPAEPTYFWQSASDGSEASIDVGRHAFVQNCVGCHGEGGQGDGPQAKQLAIPPADLTAPHLWDHTDGELYWWIAHGMTDPQDLLVMPGFKPQLDDATIWSLIDFLHANNPNRPPAGRVPGMQMMMMH
jgi:putative copper export protein/mono/diheme cytochrome c family protein